ncbi:carbohydrate-binding module family 48 protein, partial [Gymnopus androsaceus JB14]
MADTYEITFEWPHTEPNTVVVTGSFDQWSSSTQLKKEENGFKGTAKIPWDEKISYKFIVDGVWVHDWQKPTETDGSGNVNNVYTAPRKPSVEPQTNGT